jgi:hypothetical protein
MTVKKLPANLSPSLSKSGQDLVQPSGAKTIPLSSDSKPSAPHGYLYQKPNSRLKVVLLGDSHALQWSGAVKTITDGVSAEFALVYRLGCFITFTASLIPQTGANGQFADPKICEKWSKTAVDWIVKYKPQYVFIALSRTENQSLYMDGIGKMMRAIAPSAAKIILIGNNPRPGIPPLQCLSLKPQKINECSTQLSRAIVPADLALEQATALNNGAGFVNVIPWVCTASACPNVIGSYSVYVDQYHLTSTYTKSLASLLSVASGLSSDAPH